VATLVLAVSARPQDYDDDYDQPATKAAPRSQPQQQPKKSAAPATAQKSGDRETSTWVPIITYDKQQGTDGSYKTQ
jgi:hypothetical protein